MSSQVKSYLIEVAANFFLLNRRHNISTKSLKIPWLTYLFNL